MGLVQRLPLQGHPLRSRLYLPLLDSESWKVALLKWPLPALKLGILSPLVLVSSCHRRDGRWWFARASVMGM